MEMFFPLRLAYSTEFGSGKQSASWLSEKSSMSWLGKERQGEEECLDAAKNRKQVAEASA